MDFRLLQIISAAGYLIRYRMKDSLLCMNRFHPCFFSVDEHVVVFQVTIVTDQTAKRPKGIPTMDEQTQRNLLMSQSSGNPFL